ncbi:MAG: ATP-binding protein [Akkermansia sp.]
MNRKALQQLEQWKDKRNRKPLIIEGARQVGKTWLMREFGAKCFKETLYINFESNQQMQQLFAQDLDVQRLLQGMSIIFGKVIDARETLLIFDEIQQVPQALTSLKYFYENTPEYHIICAGSLLGVALHHGTSFPVGKVDFMSLAPLSFAEFLEAMGQASLLQLLERGDMDMASHFKQTYRDMLRQYYYVGGMPEVVQAFCETRDVILVKELQTNILRAYEQDFSKHAPNNIVPKIRLVWNSVPAQLARDNKKFLYKDLREGARAKEYEAAMLWLSDCGLIHRIHRVSTPAIPLKAQEDSKAFKLYLLDIGLLGCMNDVEAQSLINGDAIFSQYKGALSEQYVLQELLSQQEIRHVSYYANERSSAEVDFLIALHGEIIPIEVKSEQNLKAKSLKSYREKYAPKLAIRCSMADYKPQQQEGQGFLLNLPLYAAGQLARQALT